MTSRLALIAALAATPALAETPRHADAHVHGIAKLNIAFDGREMAMEFSAPGADIVGFEHEASSEADHAAIAEALAVLAQPAKLFDLPQAADCTLLATKAMLDEEFDHDHDDHDDHHDDDDHAHKDEHHDDDHDKDHDDDHKHDHDDHHDKDDHGDDHAHDDHDDHDHDGGDNHTEFHAAYTLDCDNPSGITSIGFPYFETFKGAQEVHVQIISSHGAAAFDVERGNATLDLGEFKLP